MLTKFRSRHAEYWRVYHAVSSKASPGTIIPLQSKRAHQTSFMLGLARELPAVFTVLAAAVSAVQGEHDTAGYVLAGAEVIAGAGVLMAIALEARHLFGRANHAQHAAPTGAPRLNMSNLAAAALGYVEAWHHARLVGHFKLFSPNIVGATVSLFLARVRPRAASKRRRFRRLHVGITPTGISYLAGPRRKWRADWTEVAGVDHAHGELVLRLHDGRRHVLRADDHIDGHTVLAETRAAIEAHASHVPGIGSGVTLAAPGLTAGAPTSTASV